MAKTLYHGALRDMGPKTITIKTGPTKSKFSKPNAPKPDFVTLTIDGEEFYYPLDSQQIIDFVTQHKGQTIAVVAEGNKDDATLTAVGAPASQLPPKAAKPPISQPASTPTHQQAAEHHHQQAAASNDGMLDTSRKFIARNRVLAVLALEAAFHTKLEFEAAKKFEMPESTFTAVYSSMLYGAAMAGIKAESQGIPLDLKFKIYEPAR